MVIAAVFISLPIASTAFGLWMLARQLDQNAPDSGPPLMAVTTGLVSHGFGRHI
jgi:hypothetical protein